MFTFSIFLLIFFFVKFIHTFSGSTFIDPGLTRLEYSYATSILQPYSSKNITHCFFAKQLLCFIQTMDHSDCETEVLHGYDAAGYDYVHQDLNYAKHIAPHFYHCLIKKFNVTKDERRYLWILEGLRNARESKKESNILYPRCFELLKECDECQPSLPYYIMDEIIRTCSDEAFKNANVSSTSKKKEPSPIDELEKLSLQKIGLIATSKAAQNLTFNDLENIKFVAARNSMLQKFLCSPDSSTEISLKDTDDPSHKWFTLDEYEAVKNLLKENQYFRWFICSGIFAISSSSDLVCFPSKYKNCGDVLHFSSEDVSRNSLEKDIYANLKMCRKIAKSEDLHHSAICN